MIVISQQTAFDDYPQTIPSIQASKSLVFREQGCGYSACNMSSVSKANLDSRIESNFANQFTFTLTGGVVGSNIVLDSVVFTIHNMC